MSTILSKVRNLKNTTVTLFLTSQLKQLTDYIVRWSATSTDDEQTRLNKALMVGASVLFVPTGIVWGMAYFLLGLKLAAVFPFAASLILFIELLFYARMQRYSILLNLALAQTLILPVLLNIVLGGIINSGLVIIWSALAPFASLVLQGLSRALRWFVAFILFVFLSFWVQPQLPYIHPLPANLIELSFMMNLTSTFVITFVTAAYFVIQKERFRIRAETLLHNILPAEIAEELKLKQRSIVRTHAQTSILFADIVDFTKMSASMPARDVATMLNQLFSAFDRIAKQYHLEKIKTIGDCYMAASGVPRKQKNHAVLLTQAALDMLKYVENTSFKGRKIRLRIGIHSGKVVAGVIGREKFIYDLWGETVNIASRMESHGKPGSIQISQATYNLLQEQFVVKPRGQITVKGVGKVHTYWVLDRKQKKQN